MSGLCLLAAVIGSGEVMRATWLKGIPEYISAVMRVDQMPAVDMTKRTRLSSGLLSANASITIGTAITTRVGRSLRSVCMAGKLQVCSAVSPNAFPTRALMTTRKELL